MESLLPNHQPFEFQPNDTVPDFPFSFELERNFDVNLALYWCQLTFPLCVAVVLVYLVAIFGGQKYMRDKPRYELTVPLFLWNVGLAIFTAVLLTRSYVEMYYVLRNLGYKHSVCGLPVQKHFNPMGFWMVMGALSKMAELGDTLFIVLRKQPLIFLHWYHHITVLVFFWYSLVELNIIVRWYGMINCTIHVAMYSHFALRTIKVPIPRWLTMTLTAIQIGQFVLGTTIVLTAYNYIQSGQECHVSMSFIYLSFVVGLSYLALFAHYFYDAYITDTPMLKKVRQRRKEE